MLKKTCLFVMAVVFMMSMTVPLYASDYLHKSVDKLANGTMEVVKTPLMLYDHTKSEMDVSEHKPLGMLKGLLESPFHMVKKAGGGALDMATFPIE